MKALITALTFSSLFATASFVQSASAAPPMNATREKAIRECNVSAQKYTESTWGDVEIFTYRACMMDRNQQE